MTYDLRPWLKCYDKGVEADIAVPDDAYFSMIEKSFTDFADRPAVHFMGTTITFRQMDEYSRRFATFLTEIGCGSGDIVGINMPNIPQYLIACVGTLRAECIVTGVSPLLSGKEVAHQLNDCGARVLVTLDAIFEHRLGKFWENVPRLSHVVATSIADFMPWTKRTLGKILKKIPTEKVCPISGETVITFHFMAAGVRVPQRVTQLN
jgi:acyl-CoA synthetase (AMP-forming)/AMP-acid ligase II